MDYSGPVLILQPNKIEFVNGVANRQVFLTKSKNLIITGADFILGIIIYCGFNFTSYYRQLML